MTVKTEGSSHTTCCKISRLSCLQLRVGSGSTDGFEWVRKGYTDESLAHQMGIYQLSSSSGPKDFLLTPVTQVVFDYHRTVQAGCCFAVYFNRVEEPRSVADGKRDYNPPEQVRDGREMQPLPPIAVMAMGKRNHKGGCGWFLQAARPCPRGDG